MQPVRSATARGVAVRRSAKADDPVRQRDPGACSARMPRSGFDAVQWRSGVPGPVFNEVAIVRRFLFPWFAILILSGCQPQQRSTLVETSSRSVVTDAATDERIESDEAADRTEIPEQDATADRLTGRVVRVIDGDTVDLLVDQEDEPRQIRVRLEGIDAPEAGQPWGTRAAEYLSVLVHGKTVEVLSIGEDRYGRVLGRIYIGDQRLDVNLVLVAGGLAWHYKRYSDDDLLSDAEIAARRARRGLWADPSPIAPWDWRNQPRQTETDQPEFTPPADGKAWLNTTTGVRHNTTCDNWGRTKRGRPCEPDEGRPCGICGG
jgi:micrococcal nuclease